MRLPRGRGQRDFCGRAHRRENGRQAVGSAVARLPLRTASTPASLRCAGVIGAGAAVSGSNPPPVFGKAITSRIESVPASRAHDPVPAERDAAVRRGAVLEGVEQEAELLLRLVLVEAHHREDPLLHVLAVDTDRAAADLVAVADDVVGLGQRARRGRCRRCRASWRRGERVVHRGPGAAADRDVARGGRLVGGLEQRRVDDPERSSRRPRRSGRRGGRSRGGRRRAAPGCVLTGAGGEEDAVARARRRRARPGRPARRR